MATSGAICSLAVERVIDGAGASRLLLRCWGKAAEPPELPPWPRVVSGPSAPLRLGRWNGCSRVILFYLLIAVMPLIQHPLWGLQVGGITLLKYLGGATLLYALVYLAVGRRSAPRFAQAGQSLWFVFLACWGMASYLFLGAPGPFGQSPFMIYFSLVQLFFITMVLVDSARRLRFVVLSIVGSVAFASLHSLREWQNAGFAAGYRPGWVSGDPNYFSLCAVLAIPLGVQLAAAQKDPWAKWFCWICIIVTVPALLIAASRGALLGLAVTFVAAVARSRHRVRVAVVGAVVCLPLLLAIPSSPLRRLIQPTRSDSESSGHRLSTWRMGVRMALDNPLTGVGVGNFKASAPDYRLPDEEVDREYIAHNTYLQIWAEMGVPGLVAFLGILWGTLRTARRVRRRTKSLKRSLTREVAFGIELGLLGFAVAIFFVSAEAQKMFWLLVFVSACLPPLAHRELQAHEATEVAQTRAA